MLGRLLIDYIDVLINNNPYVTCICFMGGDNFKDDVIELAKLVKKSGKKTAVYSGDENLYDPYVEIMDYYKIGPYIESCGPLNSRTTNQKMYKINNGELEEITYKFWRKEYEI